MSLTTTATMNGKLFSNSLKAAIDYPGPGDGFVVNNIKMLRMVKKIQHQAVLVALKGGLTLKEVGEELGLTEEAVKELYDTRIDIPMCRGAIVEAQEGYELRSGGSAYDCAIVVSVEPFIMVSRDADMKWVTKKKENYTPVGMASEEVLAKCMSRLND